jgi:hypothetical protein
MTPYPSFIITFGEINFCRSIPIYIAWNICIIKTLATHSRIRHYFLFKSIWTRPQGNHIYLVTFMCLTDDTGFIFTNKSNVAKNFLYIFNDSKFLDAFYLRDWPSTLIWIHWYLMVWSLTRSDLKKSIYFNFWRFLFESFWKRRVIN